MGQSTHSNKKIYFEIDGNKLDSHHVRLLKTFNRLMTHVLSTSNESEYFDGAADALRMCASMIKQSNFVENSVDDIPYAEQVMEFSMDTLQEFMSDSKVVTYDN